MVQTARLRMMVVDDSAETREYLRKLLQFEANIDIVGMAANGKNAVDVALEVKPDLILMDINMPVMDGISAAEIIFRELPTVRVVMMSVQSEMAYLRRAMQVGAREFLIKPFTHEELLNILGEVSHLVPAPADALRTAAAAVPGVAAAQAVKLGVLVAIFSPRGGAGCSTLALNLAIALQGQRKSKVLVVEGNLRFGALDAMLNLQVARNITDLIPSLADGDPELLHAATLPHSAGIRLLAAPPSPEMADMVSPEHMGRIIAMGQQRYDYVVADLGSGLDDRSLSVMDAADMLFVLLTPDIPAIKNVRLFLNVAQSLEYPPEKIRLVLNRAQPRGGIDAAAIQRHIKHPIVASVPDSPRVAQVAINRGVPLILYEREIEKHMPVTKQLLVLANMVPEPRKTTARVAPAERGMRAAAEFVPSAAPSPAEKKGLFGRIFNRD